ncbi:D-alanyl-D-alanine carboxypeptidase family protein [Consotaella salsifontis]|uniref:D-alanyl-D-alanine carboxypeptidase n=1 Tax=Consotaella salsifontis TaxID=1365950 RepID=A0A1T4T9I6_9HYPH|nr:D-alanyl-D-alanine carboxypeptidase family protein [Consotaella salsifontis]SKA37037.1 D-alanyl-D-alanine carboxypeptidase [Consotaella salsifontis]
MSALRPSCLPAVSCVLTLFLSALAAPAHAEVSIAVDAATGKVLEEKDASAHWYPASTTKLMTAYVTLRALKEGRVALDTPVVMTHRAATEAPSKMGFEPGSVMRLDMALRMMLVKSANDVAYAIGQTIGGGSMEEFVAMMNSQADRLGMRDSNFVNPNGLPEAGQYSSARDLALLAMTIRREFPDYQDYFGTEAISFGGKVMKNGNKLLGRFEGADGMKTGYICASGFNLVSSATRDGRTIIAVVLGASGPIVRERKSAEILAKAFETDPATVTRTLNDIPPTIGDAADISQEICSSKGRTERANEREAEADRDEPFGSPYMHDMARPAQAFPVALGGAAGTDKIEPGVSLIAAYGIPVPRQRPFRPEDLIATPPSFPGQQAAPAAVASAEAATAGKRMGTSDARANARLPKSDVPIPRFAQRAAD